MGNPLGQGFSASAGIISARNRSLSGAYDDFIQTDAAINRGNSGGPLFNMDGQVIGVNTAILSPNGGSIGIGFSMASNVVSGVIDQLEEFGETRRGWLGVRIQDVSQDMADAMELDATNGAMVTDVPAGPAADAGIAPGDVIVAFDGTMVEDVRDLVNQVGAADVGAVVKVDVIRDGELVTIDVTLGRRELAEATFETEEPEAEKEPQTAEILGITLLEITDQLREDTGLPAGTRGLFVAGVEETSEAFEKGLRAGAIIEKAGRESVETVTDLQAQIDATLAAGRTSVLLLVRSGGNPRFLALSVTE
jgi:serine protease Do